MKYRGWLAISVGILTSVGLGIYGFSQYSVTQAQTSEPSPASASPDPISQPTIVGALGRLQPQGEVIDLNGPTGERIGDLLVSEGQLVKKGDELVRLENYAEQLAERNYTASQLTEAQAQLQAQTTYGRMEILEARTRVDQVDKPQLQEVEAQKATIRKLEAELTDAQTNLNRFQSLSQQGAISQQELDDRALVVRSKEEELGNAQATLRNLEAAWKADLYNAKAQVQIAEANLPLSQSQIQIASLARNLELAEARLERTRIRAPRDGQVLKILRFPGEAVSTDEGILQFGSTQQMMVVAEIYETDIGKVKVGKSATVISDAFAEELRGTVDDVGLQIRKKDVLNTDPAADVDARVVEVKIKLDPKSSQEVASLTNMQVKVRIDL